jgi:hypothetical protein
MAQSKANKPESFWCEIGQIYDPETKTSGRRYLVRCHRCNAMAWVKANSMSAEQQKRHFTNKGWSLGRRINLHLCPDCVHGSHDTPVAERQADNIIHIDPPPAVQQELFKPASLDIEPTWPCSFCTANNSSTCQMIQGRNEYTWICIECVRLCAGMFDLRIETASGQSIVIEPISDTEDDGGDDEDDGVADWYKQIPKR